MLSKLTREARLLPMKPYHLSQVLPLEKQILQYAQNVQGEDFTRELLRNFIGWHQERLCDCMVMEKENGDVIAYFILIYDPGLISQFFSHNNENLSECSYLAQVSVASEYQALGLGTELMKFIERFSAKNNKKRLLLEVHSDARAYDWYKKEGFETICSQVFMGKDLV